MIIKNFMRVFLLDDMADIIKQQLNGMIDGVAVSEKYLNSNFISRVLNDEFKLSSNDLLLIDASYQDAESGVSALDIAEQLVQNKPEQLNNMMVLLGSDIFNVYHQLAADGDYEKQMFLSRISTVPHMIYDGTIYNKTKINSMKNMIFSFAKNHNFVIENRLPSGDISKEVLDMAKKVKNNLQEAKNMIANFNKADVSNLNINSDEERMMKNICETAEDLFHRFEHDANNLLLMLNSRINSSERNAANNEKEKQ